MKTYTPLFKRETAFDLAEDLAVKVALAAMRSESCEASQGKLRPHTCAIPPRFKRAAMTKEISALLRNVCAGPDFLNMMALVLGHKSHDRKVIYLRTQFCIICWKTKIPVAEIARILRRPDAKVREMIGILGRV